MNLYSDTPIETSSEDKLERSIFVKSIANTIKSVPKNESFTIGLHGKWGSGKTSVINLLVNELNSLHKNQMDDLIVLRFEPWNYIDDSQLLDQFFASLTNALSINKGSKVLEAIGAALESYGNAASLLSYVAGIGPIGEILNVATKGTGKLFRKRAEKRDLQKLKNKVCEKLKEYDGKIIVIIDDIDRLTNDQIRMIFQLVASIANFPNIIYLLVFDRDIVRHALDNLQYDDYLEKIIQFSIALPQTSQNQIQSILFESLDRLIDSELNNTFDKDHWRDVYISCIEPRIQSIRDVKRFTNTLSMLHSELGAEIDFADLAAISVLQVWHPGFLEWIFHSSNDLCGGASFYLTGNTNSQKEAIEASLDVCIAKEDSGYAIGFLRTVFPKCNHLFGNTISGENASELRSKGRIACSECLDLVMRFCIPETSISKKEIERAIFDSDLDSLRETMLGWACRNALADFIVYLKGVMDKLPASRLPIIAEAIFLTMGKSKADDQGLFSIPIKDRLMYSAEEVLRKAGKDEAERVISKVISEFDESNLFAFASFVNSQIIDLGKREGCEPKPDKQVITLTFLDRLRLLYIEKVKHHAQIENILERPDSYSAILLWREQDNDEADKYIRNSLSQSDLAIVMFGTRTAGRWVGTTGSGWSFQNVSSEYVSQEQIVESANRVRFQKKFWDLDTQDQEKIVTIVLLDGKEESSITTSETDMELSRWQHEYIEFMNNSQTEY